MRQTIQFLGLMACGVLIAGIAMLLIQAAAGGSMPRAGARSAAGIDYLSFGLGLALGLTLAEVARLSWSDMPRRAIAWLISNQRNMRYVAFACASVLVLIYV